MTITNSDPTDVGQVINIDDDVDGLIASLEAKYASPQMRALSLANANAEATNAPDDLDPGTPADTALPAETDAPIPGADLPADQADATSPSPEPVAPAPAADVITLDGYDVPLAVVRQALGTVQALRDVPDDRLAALDYYLRTGQFPQSAPPADSARESSPPPAPKLSRPTPPTEAFDPETANYVQALDAYYDARLAALEAAAETARAQAEAAAQAARGALQNDYRTEQERIVAQVAEAEAELAARYNLSADDIAAVEQVAMTAGLIDYQRDHGRHASPKDAFLAAFDSAVWLEPTLRSKAVQHEANTIAQTQLDNTSNELAAARARKERNAAIAPTSGSVRRQTPPVDPRGLKGQPLTDLIKSVINES